MVWQANEDATFGHRVGKSPSELGVTTGTTSCPDLWELSNGDFAVIGTDLTKKYRAELPDGVALAEYESLVVIPRATLASAKNGLPNG